MEAGSPEWKARVAELLAEEAQQPMGVWYMSFAGDDGWRGGCFVEARGLITATDEAHQRGCNPGGEVRAMPIIGYDIPAAWLNRLLDQDDLSRMNAEVFGGTGEVRRWDSSQSGEETEDREEQKLIEQVNAPRSLPKGGRS